MKSAAAAGVLHTHVSELDYGWDDTVSSRYETYLIWTFPIQNIFDMIHMYMTYGFKIKNLRFQQQSECFGLTYTVNSTNI